jgi:hypothetical protein
MLGGLSIKLGLQDYILKGLNSAEIHDDIAMLTFTA